VGDKLPSVLAKIFMFANRILKIKERQKKNEVKGKRNGEGGRSNFTLRNAPQPEISDLPSKT
jgi:hypothetical protein